MVCLETETWNNWDRLPNSGEVMMITACLELVFKRQDGERLLTPKPHETIVVPCGI